MHDKSDAELVALARAGDKLAFGELAERYGAMALRVAVRVVAHAELARELAQEALLEAYLSLRRLRDDAHFRNWLYGIVLNVCRTYLRDRRADFFSLDAMRGGMRFDGPVLLDPAPSPHEIVEARDLHRRVVQAVESLPPSERDATLLFYYDQLSLREIAVALGISPNAVKARLHKARQHLRQWFVSEGGESRPDGSLEMIRVSIADVVKNERTSDDGETQTFTIVVLHDEVGSRALPIWVGPWEGQSIALGLGEFSALRPLTYNFIANLLDAVDAKLEQVQIAALKDETFYAVVKVNSGRRIRDIDARPSDALALALRTGTPIYVADEIMERAGLNLPQGAKANQKGAERMLMEFTRANPPPYPRNVEELKAIQECNRIELIAEVFGA